MGKPSIVFGSWCSGIEAASEAWLPLGWSCAYVAEIEPFPCAYLHQRHGAGRPRYMPAPEAAEKAEDRSRRAAMIRQNNKLPAAGRLINLGDLSQVSASELPPVDFIAAGFPCQDFSIAGLRASLSGGRGSLSIIGVRLLLEAADLGLVRGAILEQVPDVLNTSDNAWGNILGALVGADDALPGLEHGGKWPRAGMVAGPRARVAWRIFDAQHFGLAQRRERVWAVVDFGDGADPAAVLFERKGVFGHPPARAEARKRVAPTLSARPSGGGGLGTDFDCDGGLVVDGSQRRAAFGGNNTSGPIEVATARTASHTASGRQDFETETFIVDSDFAGYRQSDAAATLRARGADAGHGSEALVAHSLRSEGFDASEDGTGPGTPIVPVYAPEVAGTLVSRSSRGGGQTNSPGHQADQQLVAYAIQERAVSENPVAGPDGIGIKEGTAYTLEARTNAQAVAYSIMPQNSGKDYKAREVDVAQPVMAGGPVGGNQGGDYIVQPIAFSCKDYGADAGPPAPTMRAMGHTESHANAGGQLAVAFSLRGREGGAMPEVEDGNVSPALRAAEGGSTRPFIAFDETQITSKANRSNPKPGDPYHPLAAQARPPTLANDMAVRRITVVEAEILQGFRPNATLIDWPSANRKGEDLAETIAYLIGHGFTPERAAELAQTPDGPRYKAIGNSWPVPVPRWIGERILSVLASRARAA